MTDKDKLKKLRSKHNKLVKTLERIRDDNGKFVNDLSGSEVSVALYYTIKSVLKEV